jgi:hydrogenase maturation protease
LRRSGPFSPFRPLGSCSSPPVLVLALGNDILGDDGVGFLVARALRPEFGSQVDVIETGEAGLALLELIEGHDKALLLDSMVTGRHEPGTIVELGAADFRKVLAPSPHYAGLPEVLELGARMGVHMPSEIVVLGMEVVDPFTIRESLSPIVAERLPDFVARARAVLARWLDA